MSDQDLKLAYVETLEFINNMLDRYDPVIVGASMLSLTLSLYKTVLPPDDFDMMVNAVSETKDKVKPFTPPREMMQ